MLAHEQKRQYPRIYLIASCYGVPLVRSNPCTYRFRHAARSRPNWHRVDTTRRARSRYHHAGTRDSREICAEEHEGCPLIDTREFGDNVTSAELSGLDYA